MTCVRLLFTKYQILNVYIILQMTAIMKFRLYTISSVEHPKSGTKRLLMITKMGK